MFFVSMCVHLDGCMQVCAYVVCSVSKRERHSWSERVCSNVGHK